MVALAARAMTAAAMVDKFLRSRGIADERVLEAMARVPRHRFVPEALREQAYADHPLPIGGEQTISQPYIVARMTEALGLGGDEKVLEIGSGSGYQTAILASLAKSVFSVERIHSLAIEARKKLEELGFHNVSIQAGNGAFGWEEYAPYDRIVVTAASPSIPEPLLKQLRERGRMVIPLDAGGPQHELYLVQKRGGGLERSFLCPCSFVPFVS